MLGNPGGKAGEETGALVVNVEREWLEMGGEAGGGGVTGRC